MLASFHKDGGIGERSQGKSCGQVKGAEKAVSSINRQKTPLEVAKSLAAPFGRGTEAHYPKEERGYTVGGRRGEGKMLH